MKYRRKSGGCRLGERYSDLGRFFLQELSVFLLQVPSPSGFDRVDPSEVRPSVPHARVCTTSRCSSAFDHRVPRRSTSPPGLGGEHRLRQCAETRSTPSRGRSRRGCRVGPCLNTGKATGDGPAAFEASLPGHRCHFHVECWFEGVDPNSDCRIPVTSSCLRWRPGQ